MNVATKSSAILRFIRLVTLGSLMFAFAGVANAQIWESPLVPRIRSQNQTIKRANFSPEPVYQSPVEAPLEGDYRLSCGAVVDPAPYDGYYLRSPKHEKTLSKTNSATITVNYIGDGWTGVNGDSAKTAFQRAVSTWETLLTSTEEIRVDARFDSLAPNVLGSASSCTVWCLSTSPILPQIDNSVYAGDALTDALTSSDARPDSCDIRAQFNRNFANFHYGLGPPPGGTYDFETIVAHELGHGLNFNGYASVAFDTTWADPPDNTVVDFIDTTGTFFRGLCGPPLGTGFYNLFTEDGNLPAAAAAKADDLLTPIGISLVDTSAYQEDSVELGRALLSQEGGVFWGDSIETTAGTFANFGFTANGGVDRPALYAPTSWQSGSSFSHLNDADFNGTTDNMMTHALSLGELGRGPGPVTCGIMADIGWTVDAGNCAGISLPVELVAFDVTIDEGNGLVRWATATEDENAGFEVEMRTGNGPWISMGFVEGAGRSTQRVTYEFTLADLGYGKHYFRLKQIDFDGSVVYSYEVEAVKAVPGQFVLSEAYPNPFNPATNLRLVVGRTQEVVVELFDVAGRKVSTIMREEVGENEQRILRVDGTGMPSGVYVVRVSGENFVTNRRIVLLK